MHQPDKSGTIVATVLVTCFVLFVLSMCSQHPTDSQLEQMNQHADQMNDSYSR